MSLGSGSVVLVTGANAGLGLAAAEAFAATGASVLLACRNQEKAAAAAAQIDGDTELVPLDLADLASVRTCAESVVGRHDRLDVLVNNAGLMAVDQGTTADGFETQFGVNHLGHFALTAQLAPLVLSTPGSRIVTMSSFGHRLGRLHLDDLMFERHYDRWRPYFQSKLANLLFTSELQRRLTAAGAGTIAVAAHPGASRTDLGYEGKGITNRVMRMSGAFLQPAAEGILPLMRAATAPDVEGGQFYGPRWMVRGKARLETPSRRARNAEDARKLWERSEQLTGVELRL
jgi:NAD(P)-dependent dehydrogenase (short-subunit alcohol dehydrogenase family)